jgi:hypothetical protein
LNLLTFKNGANQYARGFPLSKRYSDDIKITGPTPKKIMLNMGLYLGPPDVDSWSYLTPDYSIDLKYPHVSLEKGNYTILNTQNTVVHRSILPSFFFIPISIDKYFTTRYDDIFQGYFCQMILHHLNLGMSLGLPLLDNSRNEHNVTSEIAGEIAGLSMFEKMIQLTSNLELTAKTPQDCYLEIADYIENKNGFTKKLADSMRTWINVCESVLK